MRKEIKIMPQVRVIKDKRFVSVSSKLLQDENISLKAKGMYALMQTLPVKWECSVRTLAEIAGVSKDTAQRLLKELEENGYLERVQTTDNGRFSGMDYALKSGYEYD